MLTPKTKPDRVKNWTRGVNGSIIAMVAAIVALNTTDRPSEVTAAATPANAAELATVARADAETLLPDGGQTSGEGVKVALALETRNDAGTDLVSVEAEPAVSEAAPVPVTQNDLRHLHDRRAALDLMASPMVESEPKPTKLEVSGRVVNARSGPGTAYTVITSLERGTVLSPTGMTDGQWAQVSLDDGSQKVWMHTAYLSEVSGN